MTGSQPIQWKRTIVEATAIVASILFAFAIQAWWDDHNDSTLEQRHLASLSAEFEQNAEILRDARTEYEKGYLSAVGILELTGQGSNDFDETKLNRLVAALVANKTFHLESGAYDSLLDSGELSLISDVRLRNRLAAWPSYVAEWAEEEEAVFRFIQDTLVPFLSDSVRVRSIVSGFPLFLDGESPPQVPVIPVDNGSLVALIDSIQFENLVFQRAQGTWYAMRDGETLRAQMSAISELIKANIDK
jgi:hypothetical protein